MLISPETLHSLFATYGIWAVAVIVGLESLGIPVPGETVLVLASVYTATHDGNIASVIGAAALGAIIGDNIGYLIGREFGYRLILKYGCYVGLSEGRIKLGQYLFAKHGGKVVFFGRFVAILRFLAAFLAGANHMSWTRFLIANALGGIVWAAAVGLAAYSLGRGIHAIQGPLGVAVAIATIGVMIAIFLYLRRHEAELEAEAQAALPGPIQGFRPRQRTMP